jgi:hypothetical protein
MGVRPRVPVHIIPRLLIGALDGLAMHDYFDPPAAGDDEEVEKALESIASSLFEI